VGGGPARCSSRAGSLRSRSAPPLHRLEVPPRSRELVQTTSGSSVFFDARFDRFRAPRGRWSLWWAGPGRLHLRRRREALIAAPRPGCGVLGDSSVETAGSRAATSSCTCAGRGGPAQGKAVDGLGSKAADARWARRSLRWMIQGARCLVLELRHPPLRRGSNPAGCRSWG